METYNLNDLKGQSKSYYKNCEKDLLDVYYTKIDGYGIGVMFNYIIEKDIFEIYCYIEDQYNTVSCLKNKLIKNKILSKIYFRYLQNRIENKGLKFFFKK